jgi:hypothetical protein
VQNLLAHVRRWLRVLKDITCDMVRVRRWWIRVAREVYIRGPNAALLENQLVFLLLLLTYFQESVRALPFGSSP